MSLRRKGWKSLKPGERLRAVVKAMGLQRGEKVADLGTIEVISVRREPIDAIDEADVAREGFPEMSPREFVAMFCRTFRMKPRQRITRIEYRMSIEERRQMFLPASEIRSPEEWRDQLLTVIAAGRLLSTVDVPGMIARMGLADALGAVLDPTLYRDRAQAIVYAYESGLVRPGETDDA